MERKEYDVLVLGGGPGGYVAAIRAAQLGLKTVLVERQRMGGTCLNVGCIPSKALIHAAEEFATITSHAAGTGGVPGISVSTPTLDLCQVVAWKDGIVGRLNSGVSTLLKRAGVETFAGHGTMVDGKHCQVDTDDGGVSIGASHVILATGSTPIALPNIPYSRDVISSTEALSLGDVPDILVVIGGGYIGLELGMAYARLGSRVTIVEAEQRVLSLYDADLVAPIERQLRALDIDVRTNARAESVTDNTLTVSDGDDEKSDITFSKLLVTVGRAPVTSGWGLSDLALDMDGAFVKVNERCETSMHRVYAIGDLTGEPMLAHRAMAQGDVVARVIAGQKRVFDPVAIPAVVFTDPEVVTAGLSPDEAEQTGDEIDVTVFPFAANGRAMTLDAEDGFVRIVSRRDDNAVIGLAATGRHVSELSAAFSVVLEMGACLEDVAAIIHAHPTQSEGVQEAAMKALGEGVHF